MKTPERRSARRSEAGTKRGKFQVSGRIRLEDADQNDKPPALAAYVFDRAGKLIGSADIDEAGKFSAQANLSRPVPISLVVGPQGQEKSIRQSSAFTTKFSVEDWRQSGQQFQLELEAVIPARIWHPWFPRRICVSGHIRKVTTTELGTDICPVPYLKVEVFDVDREACFHPLLPRLPELNPEWPVLRIPELLEKIPFPRPPFPDPPPVFEAGSLAGGLSTNRLALSQDLLRREEVNADLAPMESLQTRQLVSEQASAQIAASSLSEQLTLTSRQAPWQLLQHCFYSRQLVCETTTDCDGYFNCCFNWWPFHIRRGRFRYDPTPDIIIRVTQIINGVETVIYMDPYSNTRWNTSNTHIDLFLDDEDIVCGGGQCYDLEGSPVFFTRIGDDEVFQINQSSGLYNNSTLSNVAYGHSLFIYGQFGDDLTRSDSGEGGATPYYYYRLSYAPQGSSDADFKYIDIDLNDTRVDKATLNGQSHKLGPYLINGEPSLYEPRNFEDYYWYNPDRIGTWHSWLAEADTGTYILRLEVFDQNGNKLDSSSGIVDYRNGAGTGNGSVPSPLPPMTDHCDLVITLDNKRPVAEISVPGVVNDCGVIPWSAVPPLDIDISVSQENNRLLGYNLWYTKGVGSEQLLTPPVRSNNGLPGSYNVTVSGAPLLSGLTTTCAFALRLRAWSYVRNGRHWVYSDQDIDAIAIEKCPPCPPTGS
ncbi:MAG TPA: hypothetical protein DCF45_10115 [Gammaproteobacteria bacterium]|nr:hypothetical protein [Gammaproteobacteria bacterium]